MRSAILCVIALLLSSCGLAMSSEDRLDRAEEALVAGDYRAAIIDAKDVLRDEPENLRGRILLGRASAAVGDGAATEKEIRRAIELGASFEQVVLPLAQGLLQQRKYREIVNEVQPDAARRGDQDEIRLIRGNAFLGLGQYSVARELYKDALAVRPDDIRAHLGVASSYRAEGEFSEAAAVVDHVTSEFPYDVLGWIASAELHFMAGDLDRAGFGYEKAVEIAAADGNTEVQLAALAGLADTRFALQNFDEARLSVDRVVALAPDSLQALYLASRIAYIDHDWGTAQSNLQRILHFAPDYRPAQSLLGAVHLQTGNLSQAEMYLSAALAAEPENDQARRLLSETQFRMDEFREAEATLAPLVLSDEPDSLDFAMAARASLSRGDTDAAIEMLKRGIAEDPENSDLRFQLAIALMNAGRRDEFAEVLNSIDASASRHDEFRRDMLGAMSISQTGGLDEALVAANRLVGDWPKNPNAHSFRGSVLAARNELEPARASFSKATELQPGDLTALRNLALIDETQGDVAAAKNRFELIIEAQPNATWAMLGLARLAARDNDLAAAREWLQRVRSLDAGAVRPRASLAAILLAEGDYGEAEKVIYEALQTDDTIPQLHDLLGRARALQGDHAGAAMAFRNALDGAPDNDQYRLNLANAQLGAGNVRLAEQTLLEDGAVNLDHIPTAVAAASMKVESGDLGGAMQIARALQERRPQSPIPLALEGEIQLRNDRPEAANKAYDRALAIDVVRTHALRAHRIKTDLGRDDRFAPLRNWLAESPEDYEVRLALAGSLQSANRLDESIAEYQTVLERDADNGIALNNLAWTYYLTKDARAADTARRAFELMPSSGSVADTLGWILVEAGQVAEGVEMLERAVTLSYGRAEVRYHYAVGLAKSGRPDEARRILQDIVSGDDPFSSRADAERLLADL